MRKNHQKPNRARIPFHVYLGYLALVSVLLTGVSFARYITTTSGSDEARVATMGELELYETAQDGTEVHEQTHFVIPGAEIRKDPCVTYGVKTKSEIAVYVFVAISADGWTYSEENGYTLPFSETNSNVLLSFRTNPDWTYLRTENSGTRDTQIFYKSLNPNESLDRVPVIDGNHISVSAEITADEYEIAAANIPEISFQSYAVQSSGFADVNAAWDSLKIKF